MDRTVEMAKTAAVEVTRRRKAPVFVLGCGRSGTTLLYHMLLSSGNFAVYRTESNVINLLEPRFGDLSKSQNKLKMLEAWYDSRLFTLSGLDKDQIKGKIMSQCTNGGDFLRITMEEMARQQGVERWADCTPEHLLHLRRIKETIPDALIIHIIRDGRDVALSIAKLGYIHPLFWDHMPKVMASGVYWEWMVRKGRRDGRELGNDYVEVRYEQLVTEPQATLTKLGEFIGQQLDYERILSVGIGSVRSPNTSFKDAESSMFTPLGRWKTGYSPQDLATFEGLVGETLDELGYDLATNGRERFRPKLKAKRTAYHRYFDTKLYLKAKTPLGKAFVTRDLSWI